MGLCNFLYYCFSEYLNRVIKNFLTGDCGCDLATFHANTIFDAQSLKTSFPTNTFCREHKKQGKFYTQL